MRYRVSKRMWLNSNRESLCVITLSYSAHRAQFADILELIKADKMYVFGRLCESRQHIVYQATATLITLRYPESIVEIDMTPVFCR